MNAHKRIDLLKTEQIGPNETLPSLELTSVIVHVHLKIFYRITVIKISKYYHMLLSCLKQEYDINTILGILNQHKLWYG